MRCDAMDAGLRRRRPRSNCDGTCPKRVLGGPDKNLLYFDFSEVGNGPHAGSAAGAGTRGELNCSQPSTRSWTFVPSDLEFPDSILSMQARRHVVCGDEDREHSKGLRVSTACSPRALAEPPLL